MDEAEVLAEVRRAYGDASLMLDGAVTPLRGGFWAEIVAFRLTGDPAPLVARFMPDPTTAAKEIAVQRAVAGAGFPTPAVRAAAGAVGTRRAVMVMDHVDGAPLLAGLDALDALRRLPALARSIPATLAAVATRLHSLDPSGARAALSAVDAAWTPDALLERVADLAGEYGRTDLVACARRLGEDRPAPGRAVICHGDLHPLNVLATPDGGAVVLDWSAALLAPREYDVALTELLLRHPPLAAPAALRPVVVGAGRLVARRFRRSYLATAGVALDAGSLRWHGALVRLRSLTEVAGWAHTGSLAAHAGHPWVVLGPVLASELRSAVGGDVAVRAA